MMKKILITGANSYIGMSFEKYIKDNFSDKYSVDTIDMIDGSWRNKSFNGYDSVFHVAGIAHQKETKENAHLYYEINRDLAIEVAKKAKTDGVKQFLFLSSMSVYGMDTGVITRETRPNPKTNYGKSKLQAEKQIVPLSDDHFKVCVLRPPMVYGDGCRGNYQSIVKWIKKIPIFPRINNRRSLIHINNLSSFVEHVIDKNSGGLFFPQDREYVNTIDLAKSIARKENKKVYFSWVFGIAVFIARPFVKKLKKAFGCLTYDVSLSQYYNGITSNSAKNDELRKEQILFLSPSFFSYGSKIAEAFKNKGYEVISYDERCVVSPFSKAILKLFPFLFNLKSKRYYTNIINENKNKHFDYVFVIKCDMITKKVLYMLKNVFSEAKFCLYLYDSKKNIKGINYKIGLFDFASSFDFDDCESDKRLHFRPLFYTSDFIGKSATNKYDLSFCGTIHSDRYYVLKKIMKEAAERKLKTYIFAYLQSNFIYYFYKLTAKGFRHAKKTDFSFEKKSIDEISLIEQQSNVILDIQHPKQTGLTIRTIEMIGARKKIITTNENIKKYDFYNPKNILVINRENPIINWNFFNEEYQDIPKNIYEKYDLSHWIVEVLGK